MIYSDYAPSAIEINSLGIGLLNYSNIENLDLNNDEFLVVGEQYSTTGDTRDIRYSMIVNRDVVAINTTRRQIDSTTQNSVKSSCLYVDSDIICEGNIIAKNLQFDGVKFDGYNANILEDVLTKLQEKDQLFAQGHTGIINLNNNQEQMIANNIFTTAFVTIGNKADTYNNANPLNIVADANYNINNTHISLNNKKMTIDDSEASKMRIGIIGNSAESPAVISTTTGMPIEFHVSRSSASMNKLYSKKDGFPDYVNNNDLLPALIIDTNGCVGIGATQIDTIHYNTYEKKSALEDVSINVSELPKLKVDGVVQLKNIVTYDYYSDSYVHLNDIYIRKQGLNFKANEIIPGDFVKGVFIFNSNLYVGRDGDNHTLEVNNVLNVKGDLQVTNNASFNNIIVNNAIFNNETTFNKDLNIDKDVNLDGDLSVNNGHIFLSGTRINVTSLHPIMVDEQIANASNINGSNILIFASSDVLNFSSGSNLVVPGKLGVGLSSSDEYNEQLNVVKRNPNVFELLLQDSSEDNIEANMPMVYMGHLGKLKDVDLMKDRSFIINTNDNNKLHNIYFYAGVDLVRNNLDIIAKPPTLTVHQNQKVGINTASPQYALDVNGQILCSDIYINQNNVPSKSLLFILKKDPLAAYGDRKRDFYYLYDPTGVDKYCINFTDKTGLELKGFNVKGGINSINSGYFENGVKLATMQFSDTSEKMAYVNKKITIGWNIGDTNVGIKPLSVRNLLNEEYNDTIIRLYRGRDYQGDFNNAKYTGIDICDYNTSVDPNGVKRDRNNYKWFMYKNHMFRSDDENVGPLQFGYTNGTPRPTHYAMTMYFDKSTSNYYIDVNNPSVKTDFRDRDNNVMDIYGNVKIRGKLDVSGIIISSNALQTLGITTNSGSSSGSDGSTPPTSKEPVNDVVITGKKIAILPTNSVTIGHIEMHNSGTQDAAFVNHLKQIDSVNSGTPLLVYQNVPDTHISSFWSTRDVAKIELGIIDINTNYAGTRKDAYEFKVTNAGGNKSLFQLANFNKENQTYGNKVFSIYTNDNTSYMNIGLNTMQPQDLSKIALHIENGSKYLLQLTNSVISPAINMHRASDDEDNFWTIEAPDDKNRFVLKHSAEQDTYLPSDAKTVTAFVITEDNRFGLNVENPEHSVDIRGVPNTTAMHVTNQYSDLSLQKDYATIKIINSNLEYGALGRYTSNIEYNNKIYTYDSSSNMYFSGIKYFIDPSKLPKTDKDGKQLNELLFTSSNFIKRASVSLQNVMNISSSNEFSITSNYKNLVIEDLSYSCNVYTDGSFVYINMSNALSILPRPPQVPSQPSSQSVSLTIKPDNVTRKTLLDDTSNLFNNQINLIYLVNTDLELLSSNQNDVSINVYAVNDNSRTDLTINIYLAKDLNIANRGNISFTKQDVVPFNVLSQDFVNTVNILYVVYYNKFDEYNLDIIAHIQKQIQYYSEVEGPDTIINLHPMHNYSYDIVGNDVNLKSITSFLNIYPFGAYQGFDYSEDIFSSNIRIQQITYNVPLPTQTVNYTLNLNDMYSVYNFDVNNNYTTLYISGNTIDYKPHFILQNNVDFINGDEQVFGKVNKIYSKDGGIEIISEDTINKTVLLNINEKGDMKVDGSVYANNSTIYANKLVVDYIQVQGDIFDRGNNTMIFNYSEEMYHRGFTMMSSNYIHYTCNYQLYASNYMVDTIGNIDFVLRGSDPSGITIRKQDIDNPANVKNDYNLFKICEGDNVTFTIRDGGNVGIKTERPTYDLEVVGDIKGNDIYADRLHGDGHNIQNVNLSDRNTNMLAEGSVNLYYTSERVSKIVIASNIETSNYISATSNSITHALIHTSNIISSHVNLMNSNLTAYIFDTSNIISNRISALDTDDIIQLTSNRNQFIVDNMYKNLAITGELEIRGSLKVLGTAATFIEAPQSNASLLINGVTQNQSIRIERPDTDIDIMSISNYSTFKGESLNPNIFNITNRGTIGIGIYPTKNSDKTQDYRLTVKDTLYADYFKGDGKKLTNVNLNDRDTSMLQENPNSNLYFTYERVGRICVASNIDTSNYIDVLYKVLNSNITRTSNVLSEHFVNLDSNMSNYMSITSNTITQNLITTSNVISQRISITELNMSNYASKITSNLAHTSNEIVQQILTFNSGLSNYVSNMSDALTKALLNNSNNISSRITNVEGNMSNYLVSNLLLTQSKFNKNLIDTSNTLQNDISTAINKVYTTDKPYLNYKFYPNNFEADNSFNNKALTNYGGAYCNIDFMNYAMFGPGKYAMLPSENWSKFDNLTISGFINLNNVDSSSKVDIFSFESIHRFIDDTQNLLFWYTFNNSNDITKNYGNLGSRYDMNNPLLYYPINSNYIAATYNYDNSIYDYKRNLEFIYKNPNENSINDIWNNRIIEGNDVYINGVPEKQYLFYTPIFDFSKKTSYTFSFKIRVNNYLNRGDTSKGETIFQAYTLDQETGRIRRRNFLNIGRQVPDDPYSISTGNLRFQLFGSDSIVATNISWPDKDVPLFTQYTFVVNKTANSQTEVKIYSGVKEYPRYISGSWLNDSELKFGILLSDHIFSTNNLLAKIDDIRIYDRALTDDEIVKLNYAEDSLYTGHNVPVSLKLSLFNGYINLYQNDSDSRLPYFIMPPNNVHTHLLLNIQNNKVSVKCTQFGNTVSVDEQQGGVNINFINNTYTNYLAKNITSGTVSIGDFYIYTSPINSNIEQTLFTSYNNSKTINSGVSEKITSRLNTLSADDIQDGVGKKFLIRDGVSGNKYKFDNELQINNTLTVDNLRVKGATTNIETTVYKSENLEIVSDTDTAALSIKQYAQGDILSLTNASSNIVLTVDKSGHLGIGTAPSNEVVTINGNIAANAAKLSKAEISTSILTSNLYASNAIKIGDYGVPTESIHVQKTGDDSFIKIDAGGVNKNSGLLLCKDNSYEGHSIRYDANVGNMYFATQTSKNNYSNKLTIGADGNIGIEGRLYINNNVVNNPSDGVYGGNDGTKLILKSGAVNKLPYALGVANDGLWYAVETAYSHKFYSGSNVVMTIGSNLVGIGQMTPTEALHLQRENRDTYIKIASGASDKTAGILLCDKDSNTGYSMRYTTSKDLIFSTQNNALTFTDNVVFKNNGNVGIGVNNVNVNTKLHVGGKLFIDSGVLNVPSDGEVGANDGTRLVLKSGTASKLPYALGVANEGLWYAVETGYSHKFYSGSNVVMTIGNNLVGIGSMTPTEALHLQRESRDTYVKIAAGAANKIAGVSFNKHNNDDGHSIRYDTKDNKFYLYTATNGNGSNYLTATSAGYVGIGKTDPAYILDVNGIINASNFYINGKELNLSALGNSGSGGTSITSITSSYWTSNAEGYLNYSNVQVYPNDVRIKNTNADSTDNSLFYDAFVNYQFSSDTTLTIDSSKNNRHATNNGGTYYYDYQNRRNSLVLSSNTDMTMMSSVATSSKNWNSFNNLTISGWFKTEGFQDGDILFQFYDTDSNQFPTQFFIPDTSLAQTNNIYSYPRSDNNYIKCRSSTIYNNQSVFAPWKLFDNDNNISRDTDGNVTGISAFRTKNNYTSVTGIYNNTDTFFQNGDTKYYGEYVMIDIYDKIILKRIELFAVDGDINIEGYPYKIPVHFRIYATNSDTNFANANTLNWDLLNETILNTSNPPYNSPYTNLSVNISNNKEYRYYALVVNKLFPSQYATELSLSEWKLFGIKSNILIKYNNNKLIFQKSNESIITESLYDITSFANNKWFHILWTLQTSLANNLCSIKYDNSEIFNVIESTLPGNLYINKLGSTANKGKVYVSDFRITDRLISNTTKLFQPTLPYYSLVDSRLIKEIDTNVQTSISTINTNIITIDSNASNYFRIDTNVSKLGTSVFDLTSNVSNYISSTSNWLASNITRIETDFGSRITGLSSVYSPIGHTHSINNITDLNGIFNNSNLPDNTFNNDSFSNLPYGYWIVKNSKDSPVVGNNYFAVVQGDATGGKLQYAVNNVVNSDIYLNARILNESSDRRWRKICAGKADTADKLTNAVNINGVPFDGSSSIKIDASKWSNISTSNIYFALGNVGIGSSSIGPYKLDVSGTVNASDYYIDGKIAPNNWNLANNLETWYKFNGDTNAMLMDNIYNTNTLANSGAVFDTTVKKVGNGSIYFDGNAYLTIPSTVNISTMYSKNNEFSIAFWVRFNDLGTYKPILEFYATIPTTNYVVVSIKSDNKIEFNMVYNGGTSVTLNTTALLNNTWYHIAWCIQGSTWNMYVNGIKHATQSTDPLFPNVSWTDTYIGKVHNGLYLKGYLNDMRFYSKFLKDVEVLGIYNNSYVADIYTLGNVGIGTTFTSDKLYINGSLTFTSNINNIPAQTFSYIKNVNNDIQQQLDNKEPTISLGTSQFALINTSGGKVGVSTITTTQLNQLAGIGTTQTIQAQLDNKEPTISLGTSQYALINTSGGKVGVSTITTTQLNQLAGIGTTQTIQAQLDTLSTNITNKKTSQWVDSGIDIYFTNGNVGIGTNNPNTYKLNVKGNLLVDGAITATGDIEAYGSISDERLKTIISRIDNALTMINALSPFKYKTDNNIATLYGFNSDKIHLGLSAQEVQKYIPEVVKLAPFDTVYDNGLTYSKSGNDYLTIDYQKLVPVLIAGMKELTAKFNELNKEVQNLKYQV